MAEKIADEVRDTGIGKIATRFDGLLNLLTGFGRSKDVTTQNETEREEKPTQNQLDALYENHYAQMSVDLIPEQCTRSGFTILVDGRPNKELNDKLKELRVVAHMREADKWGRLYGGAILVAGVDDGLPMSAPVKEDSVKGLKFVYVLDRWLVTPGEIEVDVESPNLMDPRFYTVNHDPELPGGMETSNTQIHASRVIRFIGRSVPTSIRRENEYWGASVLVAQKKPIHNLMGAETAMGNIVQTWHQNIYKMKGLATMAKSKNGLEELTQRMLAMQMSFSMLGMWAIDADSEDFQKRSTGVSGLEMIYDRLAQSASAALRVPQTLMFEIPPPGGSSDDAGTRNFENDIEARQHEIYVPALEDLVRWLAKGMGVSGVIRVVPNPLRQLTLLEKAQAMRRFSEYVVLLIDRGVLDPMEVRASWFRDFEQFAQEFSATVVLLKEEEATKLREEIFGKPEPPPEPMPMPGQLPGQPTDPNAPPPVNNPARLQAGQTPAEKVAGQGSGGEQGAPGPDGPTGKRGGGARIGSGGVGRGDSSDLMSPDELRATLSGFVKQVDETIRRRIEDLRRSLDDED